MSSSTHCLLSDEKKFAFLPCSVRCVFATFHTKQLFLICAPPIDDIVRFSVALQCELFARGLKLRRRTEIPSTWPAAARLSLFSATAMVNKASGRPSQLDLPLKNTTRHCWPRPGWSISAPHNQVSRFDLIFRSGVLEMPLRVFEAVLSKT
jgi:hypothetical protein